MTRTGVGSVYAFALLLLPERTRGSRVPFFFFLSDKKAALKKWVSGGEMVKERNNKSWVVKRKKKKRHESAGHKSRDLGFGTTFVKKKKKKKKSGKWERGGRTDIEVLWAVSDCSQGLWCSEIQGLCLVNWWVGYMVAVDKQIEKQGQAPINTL